MTLARNLEIGDNEGASLFSYGDFFLTEIAVGCCNRIFTIEFERLFQGLFQAQKQRT